MGHSLMYAHQLIRIRMRVNSRNLPPWSMLIKVPEAKRYVQLIGTWNAIFH